RSLGSPPRGLWKLSSISRWGPSKPKTRTVLSALFEQIQAVERCQSFVPRAKAGHVPGTCPLGCRARRQPSTFRNRSTSGLLPTSVVGRRVRLEVLAELGRLRRRQIEVGGKPLDHLVDGRPDLGGAGHVLRLTGAEAGELHLLIRGQIERL